MGESLEAEPTDRRDEAKKGEMELLRKGRIGQLSGRLTASLVCTNG